MQIGLNLSLPGIRALDPAVSVRALFINDEPGVWFEANDSTTLFTDVAGTTPVTAPGDAVALQLDKSQGLTLGPELAGTSTTYTKDTDADLVIPLGTLSSTRTYLVSFTKFDHTAGTPSLGLGGVTYPALVGPPAVGDVEFVSRVVSGGSSNNLSIIGGAGRLSVRDISVRELPGNHRTQATVAARPLYALHPVGGVRNLLQYTEEFDNAVWNKTTVTITADDAVAPDGTTSADLFQHSSAGGQIDQDFTVTTGATATISLYIKAKTDGFLRFLAVDGSRSNAFGGWFNTATGEFETANGSGVGVLEGTSVRQIGDYYRVSITGNIPGNTIYSYFFYAVDADGSFTRSTTPKFWVWGAQAEEGSTATNYQRVGSFLDVSEEGKARRGRIWYNGTSHFMETGTITPGTDKVQVFAGVRKLSDASAGTILSFGNIFSSDNGGFGIDAPRSSILELGAYAKGTTLVQLSVNNAIYQAPISGVFTNLFDIAGDSISGRWNAIEVYSSTSDLGTGNFLPYVMRFGSYISGVQFFNGYEDTSIIRFGPNLDADTISKVESYVASKTPEPTL